MPLNITKDSIDLGLVTDNVDAMRAFYQTTLGLELEGVVDMPTGAQMTRLKSGTTVIKLLRLPKAPAGANPPGGMGTATGMRYFTITIDNLAAAVAECEAAGYTIAMSIREARPGITIAMIEDPDGNWVELLEHT